MSASENEVKAAGATRRLFQYESGKARISNLMIQKKERKRELEKDSTNKDTDTN